MADVAMIDYAMTRRATRLRLRSTPIEYFPCHALTAAGKAGPQAKLLIAALKRVRENWAVPPGLQSFVSAFPALKRWAKLGRPFGAGLFVVAVANLLCVLCASASAQTQDQAQDQTQAQTRRQLLQELDSGQFRDAVLLGQQAVSRWPRDAQFRHYLGVAYFKGGDLKSAQEQLMRARELNPKEAAIHLDLALVFLSEPDYAGAADELEAAIKISPSTALWHTLLVRAYLNSNRSLQAIAEFKTALKLDPAIKLGHYHLGFAYFSLGPNDEAIAEYKEELRRSGESPAVVYELGRSLLESGKYEAAVTYLQRATELDAPNPDAWYNLGKAQGLAGEAAPAEACFCGAAGPDPN